MFACVSLPLQVTLVTEVFIFYPVVLLIQLDIWGEMVISLPIL